MRIKSKIFHGFLCLICGLLLLMITVATDTNLDTMLDPVCQARCLRLFKDSMTAEDNGEDILQNPFQIKSYCLNQTKCKGCLKGCSNPARPQENCLDYCRTLSEKSQDSCSSACNFIQEKKTRRLGLCPAVRPKNQCFDTCEKDADCFKQGTKCCKHDFCNSTCQIAAYPKIGVPPVPAPPVVRQIADEKSPDQIKFDLDWSNYNISSVDFPVLFVVQIRVGQLNDASKTVYDRWRNLVSTSKKGVIISSVELDTWYQFRLLALSEHGFRNVGEMTLPITVLYKPTNPIPPKNVSEKVTRIINGKISVTLVWQPGDSKSLLPLSNYKISWKRVYELNENSPLVTEYETLVPASDTQYIIENLFPSATYMVKIASIVVYKKEKYSSSPTVHYISTASIPQQKTFLEKFENRNENIVACTCGQSNIYLPVDIENFTMINGQLAMKIKLKDGIESDSLIPYSYSIRWRTLACIELQLDHHSYSSSEKWQTIIAKNYIDNYVTGLRFHCNYQIEINQSSQVSKKVLMSWQGCFCTPSCSAHFSSTGISQSPCPNQEHNIIPTIDQVKVIIKRSTNKPSSEAELYWNVLPRIPVSAFRITWGPRLEEPIDETLYSKDFMPLLDTGKAFSRVVNYPIQKSVLRDLDVGKIYIVKLQAIDDYSASRESSIFFKVHSDKNSSYKDRFLNYFLLLLSIFISWYHT